MPHPCVGFQTFARLQSCHPCEGSETYTRDRGSYFGYDPKSTVLTPTLSQRERERVSPLLLGEGPGVRSQDVRS